MKRLFCIHQGKGTAIKVSGYGRSEYEIFFCLKCDKLFWKQSKTKDGDTI